MLVKDGVPTVSTTEPDSWASLPSSLSSESKPNGDGWSLSFPTMENVYDLESRRTSSLADYYRAHIRATYERLAAEGRQFGALIIEPTCLGAGGMVFVDPLFQYCLTEVTRASEDLFSGKPDGAKYESSLAAIPQRDNAEWQGLPVIYDEGELDRVRPIADKPVFSGLHRFGYHSAAAVLGATPDISVYAKILTGGLLPLSATLASKSIFAAFLSDKKVDALLHGHSYTANPIGCAVALRALGMIEDAETSDAWATPRADWGVRAGDESARWSFWRRDFLEAVSKVDGVSGAMAMGTVLAIELEDANAGEL